MSGGSPIDAGPARDPLLEQRALRGILGELQRAPVCIACARLALVSGPSARVVSLQLHRERCVPPTPVDAVIGRIGGGFEGDSHVAKTTRSVLVVDRAALDDLGLGSGDLREQVTVEGVRDVTTLAPGTLLRIGGITLRVNGECEPCLHIVAMLGVEEPDAFRLSLVGRRGAVCTVVEAAGVARVGDRVEIVAPVAAR